MEAQSDYIKDFQRRLQSEYQKAGLLTIPESDILGGKWLGGYPNPGVSRTPSCPLLEVPKAHSLEGPADEGAGGNSLVRRFYSVDETRRPSVSFTAYHPDVASTSPSNRGAPTVCTPAPCLSEPEPELNVSEVAKEVVRLRLLKKQHDELGAALSRSETQLRRLSPCAVLQFYSYLEKHLGDSGLASTVPEAMLKLVQCLCALCGVAVTSHKPDGILNSVRMLLREPHSFTSKLCNMPHVSGDEAQGLAPFLLSEVQYKRVRDKDVNACYEAFHAWLSAFYFFSVISDQVAPTAQELERQEALLRRLNGQEDLSRSKSAPALSPRGMGPKVEAPHATKGRTSVEAPPHAGKRRSSVNGRRSACGDDDEKSRGGGHAPASSRSGHASPSAPCGSASPSVPRGSASPSAPRGNTGVTRRTNAPPAAALQQPARRSAAAASGPGAARMQSDALLSTMRAKRDSVTPASPVLQSRTSRMSSLGVGGPLQAVPERQLLEAPPPSVYRRSTAPPLRPGCSP